MNPVVSCGLHQREETNSSGSLAIFDVTLPIGSYPLSAFSPFPFDPPSFLLQRGNHHQYDDVKHSFTRPPFSPIKPPLFPSIVFLFFHQPNNSSKQTNKTIIQTLNKFNNFQPNQSTCLISVARISPPVCLSLSILFMANFCHRDV
jgi:hypothetical protein